MNLQGNYGLSDDIPRPVLFPLQLTNEVKLLSGLKHPNVVGYNTSWIDAEPVKSARLRRDFAPAKPVNNLKCQPSSSERYTSFPRGAVSPSMVSCGQKTNVPLVPNWS